MALNPFFQQGSQTEQNLIQDLINEQLRMYGVEVYYLPRHYVTEKTIIREVIESHFTESFPIEAYVNDYEGYGDNTQILSKFGIQATNEINLIISQERFELFIAPLFKHRPNVRLTTRPKEGDLIYFPLGDRLFEIKFVEHEKPFYQLQKNYVYELRCELFRYEDEIIATGVDDIDDTILGNSSSGLSEDELGTLVGPSQTLTLVGTGITATATATLVDGGIRLIEITNRGGGYTSKPSVGISSAPSLGKTGIATVGAMIGGIVACLDNINPSAQSVQTVEILDSGYGYTVPPGVKFIGGGGAGAAATSKIGDNIVGIVTLTNGGGGYTLPPTVSFTNEVFLSGVTTVSAAATAKVSTAGTITSIHITNAGLGYSIAPTITIGNPSIASTGNFKFNEVVTGSVSGTTARVKVWDSDNYILEIYAVRGDFVVGENIVGSTSGATRELRIIDLDPPDDGFADNKDIQTEANAIIDFTEKNPFGIP